MKHTLKDHAHCVLWTPRVLLKLLWGLFCVLCSVGAVLLSNLIELFTGRYYHQEVPPTMVIDWSESSTPKWFGALTYGGYNFLYRLRDTLLYWLTIPMDSSAQEEDVDDDDENY